jgi:hypothetical protein
VCASGSTAERIARTVNECELCAAERVTEWFYEDELCWVAECEACYVPMVVWKRHDPTPPEEVRAVLLDRLRNVVVALYTFGSSESGFWIDEHMRTIPTHYHAHARPRGGYAGHGTRRP